MAKNKEARIARLYAGPEVVRDSRPSSAQRPGDPRGPRYPGSQAGRNAASRVLPYTEPEPADAGQNPPMSRVNTARQAYKPARKRKPALLERLKKLFGKK